MRAAIAAGLVVSRTSPSRFSLSEGSVRSRRVIVSPWARMNAVRPSGPPIIGRSRFAALLSLTSTAASASSAMVRRPRLRFAFTTGAWSRMSASVNATCPSRPKRPASAPISTAAASGALNVEHMAKRSSRLKPRSKAPLLSTRATPRRPPVSFSISRGLRTDFTADSLTM